MRARRIVGLLKPKRPSQLPGRKLKRPRRLKSATIIVPVELEHDCSHELGTINSFRLGLAAINALINLTGVTVEEEIQSRLIHFENANNSGELEEQDSEVLLAIFQLMVDRCLTCDAPATVLCRHCVERRKHFGLPLS